MRHRSRFDSIVVSGMSGVIVGAPVALRISRPLVVVRKPDEPHHNNEQVINEHRAGGRWLFLDDFTASGDTLRRCYEALDERQTTFAGTYQYSYHELILDGRIVSSELNDKQAA
jgi:adenine/guanine phosphoribosyltransferase-like PRPP-binding protein